MTMGGTKLTFAAILLLFLTSSYAQEQRAPDGQAPPEATTPQGPGAQPPSQVAPSAQPESGPPQAQSPAPTETAPPAPKSVPDSSAASDKKPTDSGPAPHTFRKSVNRKSVKGTKSTTPKPRKRHSPATVTNADQTGKIVVRNGGAKDDTVQLSPGGGHEQDRHNRENTTQLLTTTDQNLKRLAGRQLTSAEQSTIDQIHTYVRQAKSAADSGDMARAHTLAFKAHLLSDELAKR